MVEMIVIRIIFDGVLRLGWANDFAMPISR